MVKAHKASLVHHLMSIMHLIINWPHASDEFLYYFQRRHEKKITQE